MAEKDVVNERGSPWEGGLEMVGYTIILNRALNTNTSDPLNLLVVPHPPAFSLLQPLLLFINIYKYKLFLDHPNTVEPF